MAKREHASWEFEAGTEIAPGRSVLRSLGGGSRYEVFLVWDERLFTPVAAKVLRPDQVDEEKALRDLRREAEWLERLAHPVLVRGFGAVLEGPHPHVVVEHFDGHTLRKLIKRGGPVPLPQLLPLALNVAAAIHYLGTEEVVHLDVKPDNIVMGIPPRLIDLSVARSFSRAKRINGTVGTDAYMAPEQADPETHAGRIGPAADVWGLAATLFHAAAGKVPFPRRKGARESDDRAVRFPQLEGEPGPLPPDTPPELAELIGAGLRKDPDERPTAAD
ncbi:MAG: serine/threonine protein kinase, partial [Actinomycetota bacterium]|nr:serine/threonine protein kinase [Actinomycetota bacterium]